MTVLPRVRSFWDPYEIWEDIDHVRNRRRREDRILRILDDRGFSVRVFLVAFLGFLASSWSLIATNITMPMLFFVYENLNPNTDLVLDMVTLIGTVVGMVVFGHLADRLGRSALYGFELLIVLAAVGGAAFSSQGYVGGPNDVPSMNIYGALICWRLILGLGIGAEYPMSAVIAAEFASTAHRGTMLAAIFAAQPVGRLLAYGLGLGILRGMSSSIDTQQASIQGVLDQELEAQRVEIDKVWRLVLGLAGVPAVFAVGLRIFIPETPRFYSAIKRDLRRAYEVVTIFGTHVQEGDVESINLDGEDRAAWPPTKKFVWGTHAYTYFFGPTQGWKHLAWISLQWMLLDITFYGTGLDSSKFLSALALRDKYRIPDQTGQRRFELWNNDIADPYADIHSTLEKNATRTLEFSSLAAACGSLLVIPLMNYVSRKKLYVSTTFALAITFAITAGAIFKTIETDNHVVAIVFYALTQFMFNLGPNTLTFVLAAEIFPTEFRGTCYGIAAASGKVGAIIIRPIINNWDQGRHTKSATTLTILFSIFAGILLFMAILAWLEPWGISIPQVQELRRPVSERRDGWNRFVPHRLTNLSLEKISPWPDEDILQAMSGNSD